MFKSKTLKKMIFISLVSLMLVLSFSSCLVEGKTLTEKNNGDSFSLEINDVINIKLISNPTTGYRWVLIEEIDGSIISLIDSEFIQSKKDKELVGTGGYEIFSFKAIPKGKTSIILNYERPWEDEVEPLETFEIIILVD